jgi:hypothetical protein
MPADVDAPAEAVAVEAEDRVNVRGKEVIGASDALHAARLHYMEAVSKSAALKAELASAQQAVAKALDELGAARMRLRKMAEE